MTIATLVTRYQNGRDAYKRAGYNESQLRTDFLDPLFRLLGWDITNEQGKPTNEREVLVEEALREDANSHSKKPDYTFRLFSERKFFLEAKKPSVNIDTDPEPAKQVRRYGLSGNVKISVLSNFEYLAIYDCSHSVAESDGVSRARVRLYHYTEYEEYFEEIKMRLGHEAVYSGDFEVTWQEIEGQLRLTNVGDLFLDLINNWRVLLGTELYSHNPEIEVHQLNDLVQSYINSIIFLRVCEDRNIEVYKTLLGYADSENFEALFRKLVEADRKYNAGLFELSLNEEIISNSGTAFWSIIKQLYFPESTYSFAVFASDILGDIYEMFLGYHLEVEQGVVSLQKKPENIDRDIVTTPTFIIKDILRKTVTAHCTGKSDTEILESKFADIACGSGAFLLETYQLLHDTLVDYYIENDPTRLIQTAISNYKLKFETKRQLLLNCVFGFDKDYNAVQACKFGLLLKLLEDENNDSIAVPALPNMDENICFGNSLIDSQLTNEENQNVINPYDFRDSKFDVIVGNPPYMATEHMKQFTPLELPIYKRNYETAFMQFDKYFLFIERGFSLLNEGGFLGFIVPSKFSKVGAGNRLRRLLSNRQSIKQLISFGANQVFENKTTYTCLLIGQNSPSPNLEYLEVQSFVDWKTRNISDEHFDEVEVDTLEDGGWVLVPGALRSVYDSIIRQSQSLSSLIGNSNIYNGIQTSANSVYVQTATEEDDEYLYFVKDGEEWKVEKELTRPYFQTSSGIDNLYTYRPFASNAFVIYPYVRTDRGIEFVELNRLRTRYPFTYDFLNRYQERLKERDIKPEPETEDEWYRYGRHQSLEKCDVPAKIIVGVLSQGDKYAIDYHGTLISSGGTAGYCMITLPNDSQYSIHYIQAILNSKYLEWFSALQGEVFRGGFIARGTKVLKRLPIRVINFENTAEQEKHDRIAQLQESMIELQGQIDQNIGNNRILLPLKRRFGNLKNELNDELRSLYDLGEEDNLIPLISELYAAN